VRHAREAPSLPGPHPARAGGRALDSDDPGAPQARAAAQSRAARDSLSDRFSPANPWARGPGAHERTSAMMLFLLALLLPPPPAPPEDPIGQKLYPPELIMAHQQELGIDDKQREAIVKEVQTAQTTITKLSWQMQAEAERMAKLLDSPKVD